MNKEEAYKACVYMYNMSKKDPIFLYEMASLGATTLQTYSVLIKLSRRTGKCKITHKKLAKLVGCSISSISKAVRKLVDHNAIAVISSEYIVNPFMIIKNLSKMNR